MKASSVGTELLHVDRPIGIKLIVVFRVTEGSQLTIFTELNLVSHVIKEGSSEHWMRRIFGSKRKKNKRRPNKTCITRSSVICSINNTLYSFY